MVDMQDKSVKVANDLIEQLSISDVQYILEDGAVWVEVNDRQAAGFTLVVDGVPYIVNVSKRR